MNLNATVIALATSFGPQSIVLMYLWAYLREHDLPSNPLHDQGYPSIGCQPCTKPVRPGDDPRAGRWSGWHKTECGIHST